MKLKIAVYSILLLWVLSVTDLLAFHSPEVPLPIKIGLLIPDNKFLAARKGAEMAILEANKKGGFDNHPFQLMVSSTEGPWGTGSKQAVNMVFDEEVWAIVGSNDGRTGHLIEQVAAKTHIVFLSAWATDPSLSRAFVPWYFCCVPNDVQQALALFEEIYNKRKFVRVAAISDDNYDSKLALQSLINKTQTAGTTEPLLFHYDNSGNINDMLNQIEKSNSDCIILFVKSSSSEKLLQLLKSNNMKQPVFGTIALQDENQISGQSLENFEKVVLVSSEHWVNSKSMAFREEYQKRYGTMPGPVAAYAYDGMSLIISAIRNAGLDRERIQKSLSEISYEGVTGLIQFDDKGNRLGAARLIVIKNGFPVPLER